MASTTEKTLTRIAKILLLAVAAYIASALFYPNVARLKRGAVTRTAFLERRVEEARVDGRKLRVRQQWIPFSRISPLLVKAVVIAEDAKFWGHEGFDFDAMQNALKKNLRRRRIRGGGSTITQQLAKNLFLSPSKNPIRKIREAILTARMERALSKRRILEIYLNVVEWGDGVFGAEAAAHHWFGKSAGGLTPEEVARLAAVLPNPRRFSPTGPSPYVARRTERILAIMARQGIIVEEFEEATRDTVPAESSTSDSVFAAPRPDSLLHQLKEHAGSHE